MTDTVLSATDRCNVECSPEQRAGKTQCQRPDCPVLEMDAAIGYPAGEYAIVELYGHSKLIGRIAEVDRFGSKMLQIEPLFNGQMLAPVLHGGGSIYRLVPCDAATAFKHQPTHGYQLPDTVRAVVPLTALPAPEDHQIERPYYAIDDAEEEC